MRIVIAPDSFKGSMTAPEAAAAMTRGVHRVLPAAECLEVPMADGGEGTTAALVAARGGQLLPVACTDALGAARTAHIGLLDQTTAAVEVAEAVGLDLIPSERRDVSSGTSRGVADLLRAALDAGADRILVGLGGTGTDDAGAGLLVGLGARLLDADDQPVPPQPGRLAEVARVDLPGLDARWGTVQVDLACDVTSPLLGPRGASCVFAPQKGASPETVARHERGHERFADALERAIGRRVREEPGAGAAGGLGFALLALGAHRHDGAALMAEAAGLADHLAGADLVLTGEGSLDAQTAAGKAPAGVARMARAHGVPVIALAGRVDPSASSLVGEEFAAILPIVTGPCTAAEAMAAGPENLEQAAAMALRLVTLGAGSSESAARSHPGAPCGDPRERC